ncbi:MAG TPA: hypothetical protein VLH38_04255 [Patescibacteria group bacterium]|nr:hypothetical protein [Patescibacteria group bacterium]
MFRFLFISLLAALPSSTNYTLKNYDFGSGANTSSSTNYTLRGQAGGSGGKLTSTTYGLPAGIQASSTAAVPPAPTITNPNNTYDRLHLVLNTNSFPSDTKYLIAISSDNFVSTKYVQLDNTIGAGVTITNYQTYAAWGSASGFDVVGLSPSTTYTVKAAALQGIRTGSGFGPTASTATQAPNATFSMQTSLTATPPFTVDFTSLPAGAITSGGATVTTTVTTNALYGGNLLIADKNSGLTSAAKSTTLASATTDLGVASSGYGAQVTGTSQSSGGPIGSLSPYNGAGNNVGGLNTGWQPFATWNSAITTGSATLALTAKTNTLTPAATDYADVMTISLSLLF